MTRVCIIGNSHVRCWKQGWRNLPSEVRRDFDVTFFGAVTEHLSDMVYSGGRFTARDDKGKAALKRLSGQDSIELAQYDAFILVGVGLNFRALLSMSRQFGTLKQRRLHKARHLVSEACFRIMLRDMYGFRNPAIHLAQRLRKVSSTPIILVPAPCPSAVLVDPYRVTLSKDLYARFLQFLEAIVTRSKVTLLPQNPRTMEMPGYTSKIFSTDRPNDFSHMNADFGRIMLSDALDMLEVMRNSQAVAKPDNPQA